MEGVPTLEEERQIDEAKRSVYIVIRYTILRLDWTLGASTKIQEQQKTGAIVLSGNMRQVSLYR